MLSRTDIDTRGVREACVRVWPIGMRPCRHATKTGEQKGYARGIPEFKPNLSRQRQSSTCARCKAGLGWRTMALGKGANGMSIGSRISRRRRTQGMTQNELAEKVGVTFQAVSSWERDEHAPDTDKLKLIAKALEVKVAFLLGEEDMAMPDFTLHDRLFHEEHMYTFVKAAAASLELAGTLQALPYARKLHREQKRKGKDGVPYISHPLTMACHALAMGIKDDDVLASILLHDVAEDCGVKPEELPANERVKDIVSRVTKDRLPGEERDAFMRRYHAGIAESPAASLVKVIDRCNNLSMMATGFDRDKMIGYIQETEAWVFPLIEVFKGTPAYCDAAFLLKYQMLSVMEALKRTLAWMPQAAGPLK